jgi:hypothetical protein
MSEETVVTYEVEGEIALIGLVWLIRPRQSGFWSDTLWSVAATVKGLKRNRRQSRRAAAFPKVCASA